MPSLYPSLSLTSPLFPLPDNDVIPDPSYTKHKHPSHSSVYKQYPQPGAESGGAAAEAWAVVELVMDVRVKVTFDARKSGQLDTFVPLAVDTESPRPPDDDDAENEAG
jgi:hypothetical protein